MSSRRRWHEHRAFTAVFCLLFLMLCAWGSPVWAGVVEDAEEILRDVDRDGPDGPRPRTSGPPRTVPSSSVPAVASPSRLSERLVRGENGPRRTESSRADRNGNRFVGDPGDSSVGRAGESQSVPAGQRRAIEQRVSGYLLLLLILLVLAATFAGRSLEGRTGDSPESE